MPMQVNEMHLQMNHKAIIWLIEKLIEDENHN